MLDDPGESSVRKRLMDAAILLFTTRGYAATSVREIVEMAGLTKPALYYHFQSKEGIYLAILDELVEVAEHVVVASRSETGTARKRIQAFLTHAFDHFQKRRAEVRMINAVFWGPAQGVPPFDFETFHRKFLDFVRGVVEEGIARGELRPADPEVVTLAIVGVLSFNMDLNLAHPEIALGQDGLRQMLELVFDGLASPAFQEKPQ